MVHDAIANSTVGSVACIGSRKTTLSLVNCSRAVSSDTVMMVSRNLRTKRVQPAQQNVAILHQPSHLTLHQS